MRRGHGFSFANSLKNILRSLGFLPKVSAQEVKKREKKELNQIKAGLQNKNSLAVIIVDMQEYFLEDLEEEDRNRIIENQINIIHWCAKNNCPIVVLEYYQRGPTIGILKEKLKRVPRVKTVIKRDDNGFEGTKLNRVLNKLRVKTLLLVGINANACVRSTACGGKKNGFNIATSESLIANDSGRPIDQVWFEKNTIYEPTVPELLNAVV